MGIKIYISGISGNKEVKKRQQRVLMILDSKNIKYDVVDIAEPGNEDAKEFMQSNAKSFGATIGDANPRSPLPPQIFNDEDYCGDYDQFDLSNEIDEIEKFLKLPHSDSDKSVVSNAELKLGNGETIINSNNESADVTEKNVENIINAVQENLEIDSEAVTKDTEVTDEQSIIEAAQEKDEKKESTPEKEASPEKEIAQDEIEKTEPEEESKEKLENGNDEDISEEAAEA